MASWSELTDDILDLILQNLTLTDHFRFSSVCVSWNLAVRSRSQPSKPQSPWLILPGDEDSKVKIFSLSENRIYNIPLPPPMIRRRFCIGSSFGWLITVDEQSDLHLLNPVTRVQVQLPSITTLPFVDAILDSNGRITEFAVVDDLDVVVYRRKKRAGSPSIFTLEEMPSTLFRKAVLSSAPDANGGGDYAVMLFHIPGYRLAFARAGGDSWIPLRTTTGYSDILGYKGQFYTVDAWGAKIEAWDDDGLMYKHRTITKPIVSEIAGYGIGFYHTYLVESLEGKLLLVLRDTDSVEDESVLETTKTVRFEVLVRDEAKQCWRLARDLGNNVLFVGNNSSMSFDASKYTELRRNCIYFTDDDIECSSRDHKRDMGIFNMKDKSVSPMDFLDLDLDWPLPIWVTPTL